MKKIEIPPGQPRIPNGVCHHCGADSVPFGCFCPACYGGCLHPDGLPMVPGDPDDPYREFNAEADAFMADRKMPDHVGFEIDWWAYKRQLFASSAVLHEHVVVYGKRKARIMAGARPGETWAAARKRLGRIKK